jgi:hypothetical protein
VGGCWGIRFDFFYCLCVVCSLPAFANRFLTRLRCCTAAATSRMLASDDDCSLASGGGDRSYLRGGRAPTLALPPFRCCAGHPTAARGRGGGVGIGSRRSAGSAVRDLGWLLSPSSSGVPLLSRRGQARPTASTRPARHRAMEEEPLARRRVGVGWRESRSRLHGESEPRRDSVKPGGYRTIYPGSPGPPPDQD